MRSWFGPFLRGGAALLVALLLFARPILKAADPGWYYAHDLIDRHSLGALVLLVIVVLGLLATVVWPRLEGLAFCVALATFITLADVALQAFTMAEQGAPGVYPGLVAALGLGLVGLAIAPPGGNPNAPLEVGELLDGQRHGQWFIYGPDKVVNEIRQYDRGTLVSSRPYTRK